MTSTHHPTHDPKWRRLPDERPRQIIEAALTVFSEQGFTAAKLDEIAKRTGVSKGTIYLYFPSKEELFKAVVRNTIAEQLRTVDFVPLGRPASLLLEKALRGHWGFSTSPRFDGWFRILVAELPKHPELLAFYNEEVIDRAWALLQQIVQYGIDRGEFRPLDARRAVGFVNSLVVMHRHWISTCSIRPEYQSIDRDELIDGIVDFALHALKNPSPAPVA